MSENWISIANASDIQPGTMKGVEVAGAHIAIYNVDGEYCATSNICTHAFAYLTEGWLDGHLVECPLHAGLFDVRTGAGQGAPITCGLQTFPVRVQDGRVEIAIP